MNKDVNNINLDQDLKDALLFIVKQCELEDDTTRKVQLAGWKKQENFWHGFQHIYWSMVNNDWINPIDVSFSDVTGGRDNGDNYYPSRTINIYKAHGESVIAALSAQLPNVKFIPDDADNELDVITAKTYSRIAELIQKHNNSKIMFLKALLFAWNQGLIFSYFYPKSDPKYGTIKVNNYDVSINCQACGYTEKVKKPEDQVETWKESNGQIPCPQCQNVPLTITSEIKEILDVPKVRICSEQYSPIDVKVPLYARDQEGIYYLIHYKDLDIAQSIALYPYLEDKLNKSDPGQEKWYRSPSSIYQAVVDAKKLTLRRVWLRTDRFNLVSKDLRDKLFKLFPNGCYVATIGDLYAESRDECLDDYWEVGKCGLSTYIHSDSLGKPLMDIQELKNDLVNLTSDTIEHGIPSTFADPDSLDFEAYSKQQSRPGDLTPAHRKAGEALSQSFYDAPRATLSQEVGVFDAALTDAGQFVVGSLPSIWGGSSDKETTASEYSQSRQMALQRLSIAWTFLCQWWANSMHKAVKLYVQNMIGDERFVKEDQGNYINVWIRRVELEGKVGAVEPEGDNAFPITSAQKAILLMKLMEMNNEFLNSAIFDPANRQLVANLLGFPDFKIPGEQQQVKQVREIQLMVKQGAPLPIDPEVDDHEIHSRACTDFLVSDVGIELQMTQPRFYEAIKQHKMMHDQIIMQNMMAQKQEEEDKENETSTTQSNHGN